MLTNQRPKGAVRLYALRFMVYGGPSNAMTVVVPRNETPKAALGTIGGGHVLESSPVAVANPAKRPDVAANGGYSRGSR